MNELRRGTWQVRQVRQQQHAWATNDAVCSDSWLVGELAKHNSVAININGSFSRQTETCSTCPIREHLLYLSRCTFGKRLYAMLCALVRGFFSSASSAVSYFQRLNRFANILRTSSPTGKLNNQNENYFWKLKRLCQLKSKAGPIFFNTANGEHPSTPRHQGWGCGLIYVWGEDKNWQKGWEKEGWEFCYHVEQNNRRNPPTTPLSHNVAHAT